MIKKLRKIGKPDSAALLPFQRGILLACKGMKQLFPYLKERYGFDYVLTKRLNQDFIENLFSVVRAIGATNDHPDATDALDRLRLHMIGQDTGIVVENSSVKFEEDSEVVMITGDIGRQILSPAGDGDVSDTDAHDEIEQELPPLPSDIAEAQDEMLRDPEYDAQLWKVDGETYDEYDDTEDFDFDDPDFDDECPDSADEDDDAEMEVVLTPPPAAPAATLVGEEKEFDSYEQALTYVAGWLAAHFSAEPGCEWLTFGITAQLPPEFLEDYPWLKAVSRGGLTVPNSIFVDYLRDMEKDFDFFHDTPDGIDLEKDVFNRMAKVLYEKYPDVPQKVVLKYVRFRTFVLMKFLNNKLALEKAKSKKTGDQPYGRRAARKMKHFCS